MVASLGQFRGDHWDQIAEPRLSLVAFVRRVWMFHRFVIIVLFVDCRIVTTTLHSDERARRPAGAVQ